MNTSFINITTHINLSSKEKDIKNNNSNILQKIQQDQINLKETQISDKNITEKLTYEICPDPQQFFDAISAKWTRESNATKSADNSFFEIYKRIESITKEIYADRPDIAILDTNTELPSYKTAGDILQNSPHWGSHAENIAMTENLKENGRYMRDILSHSAWDFTLKDGKIEVIGEKLNSDQISFIEKKLNDDIILANGMENIYNASKLFYEEDTNPIIKKQQQFQEKIYRNVDIQLNKGILPFKEVMAKSMGNFDRIVSDGSGSGTAGSLSLDYFYLAISSIGKYLTPIKNKDNLHVVA